jgi:hypothetical protein
MGLKDVVEFACHGHLLGMSWKAAIIMIFCAQFARHYNYLKDSGVLKFIVDKNFREVNL